MLPLRVVPLILSAPAFLCLACGDNRAQGNPSASPSPSSVWFEDITEESGVEFTHVHGGSGERYMVETMGSGGGFLDVDGDGWLDIFLLQGDALPGYEGDGPLTNRLFHNRGDGTFVDVTAESGLGDAGYAMGACFGDIDNDGLVDVHVTAYGADRLFRNVGGGRFVDVTEQAGIDNPRWAASCAFADYDRDGFLDLYVTNYLDATLANHRRCGGSELPVYCHPDAYAGVPDLLYHNRGDGTFEEVGAAAGIRIDDPNESKGLGVIWLDADDDGWPDIYVANDSTRNFLFLNQGDGTFREVGVLAGVAYDERGHTQAGMGVAAGDIFGSGRMDLVVTNLDFETMTLYRGISRGLFETATATSGIGPPSLLNVGFGVSLFEADNDGDLDLVVANGHILDNIALSNPSLSYAQRGQLYVNDGTGSFALAPPAEAGSWFVKRTVSRALAAGDIDNDGRLDLLVTQNNRPVHLLHNVAADDAHWVGLRLLSRHGGRYAIGARARLVAGDLVREAEVRAGSSYLAQEDPRLFFGLGALSQVDLIEIRWPNGDLQVLTGAEVPVDRVLTVRQPATADAEQRR